ncbi:MAG: glycoside hydrolase, partial [Bacteroidales bacterium]|nr:glycoside hydrolase [Bacteroidales bacterium]
MIKTLLIICIALIQTMFANSANGSEIKNDFTIKGFHIDLRCQVMTMPALKSFARELSGFGVNTIIMEWEATFPFKNHATLSNKYAYSEEEID